MNFGDILNAVKNFFVPAPKPLVSPMPANVSPSNPMSYNIPSGPVYSPPNPNVLGASTTNTGYTRNVAPSVPTAAPDNGAKLAQQAYDNRINAVRSLFDRTKSQAADIRGQAARTFDDLMKAVGAFRERAGTQYANAGQEITNQASDILGSNARTAQETLGTSRALGRALGLGDSSKFNQQNKVIANLGATQGNTIARRGEQDRSNRVQYDTRLDQAQQQEGEATRYKQAVEDQARQLETTGLDQFGENTDAASNALGQSLNSILNYQRQLAAINPLQAEGLTSYAPDFSGIVSTLNGILPTGAVPGAGGADPGAISLANDPSYQEYLKRKGLYTA